MNQHSDELPPPVEALTARLAEVESELARLRVEHARLEERRGLKATLLDHLSDAVVAVDNEYRITYMNRAAGARYGVSPHECTGRLLREVYTWCWPQAQDEAAAYAALVTQGTWRGENVHITRDGRTFHLESAVEVLRDQDGQPTGTVAVIRDMGDRRRAEAALRASQDRFRHLADAMPQLVWIASDDGRVSYYNSRAASYQGLSEKPDGSWDWVPAVHPDDVAGTIAAWETAVARGTAYEREHRILMADGTYRWHLSRASRAGLDDRAAWFGTSTDIDDVKRTEEALRGSEERLRTAARAARFGIYDIDPLGGKVVWSETLADLLGMPAEAPDDIDVVAALVHPADRDGHLAAVREALDPDGPGCHLVEFRVIRPDGQVRWLRDTGRSWVHGQGDMRRVVRVVGTVQDVTEERRAAEIDREASRQKDEFIAVLAHELRNPLAPIRMSAGVLRAKLPDEPLLLRCMEIIERQSTHMGRLLDDLLDVSRLSRGQMKLRRGTVLLQDTLEAALDVSRPLIDQLGHRLTIDAPADPVVLDADGVRLAQVFGNLLTNAAKYTPPRGDLSVAVVLERSHVVVKVRDTGRGIAPHMLDEIFNLFWQADTSGHDTSGGLGIGLALARRLVEMHDGTLHAVSQGPGTGSEFVVRLPRPSAGTAILAPLVAARDDRHA